MSDKDKNLEIFKAIYKSGFATGLAHSGDARLAVCKHEGKSSKELKAVFDSSYEEAWVDFRDKNSDVLDGIRLVMDIRQKELLKGVDGQ